MLIKIIRVKGGILLSYCLLMCTLVHTLAQLHYVIVHCVMPISCVQGMHNTR